jgi:hypothetical protein
MTKTSKLIRTQKEARRYPLAAFIFSLLFTGTGEYYAGAPLRGLAMLLLRNIPLAALPLHVKAVHGASYLVPAAAVVIICGLVTIISPIQSFFLLRRKKGVVRLNSFTSHLLLVPFALGSMAITALSMTLFLTQFGLSRADVSGGYPALRKGDMVLTMKNTGIPFRPGELLKYYDETGGRIGRVIAAGDGTVHAGRQKIYLSGRELERGILENPGTDIPAGEKAGLLTEACGGLSYRIIVPIGKDIRPAFTDANPGKDEVFLAADDRRAERPFSLVKTGAVEGRVEGVLYSPSRKRLLLKMFL